MVGCGHEELIVDEVWLWGAVTWWGCEELVLGVG